MNHTLEILSNERRFQDAHGKFDVLYCAILKELFPGAMAETISWKLCKIVMNMFYVSASKFNKLSGELTNFVSLRGSFREITLNIKNENFLCLRKTDFLDFLSYKMELKISDYAIMLPHISV